jgi:hypothetical protein
VAVMIWLIGAIVGWCAGWTARTDHTRTWHTGLAHQLTQTRHALAEALNELDHARDIHCQAPRVPPPAPAVVHVHVAMPSWGEHHPSFRPPVPVLDAMPVLPAEEVPS